MKKSLITTCFAILIVSAFISCKRNTIVGKGDSGSESRDVSGFSRIDVSAELDVIVRIDSTSSSSVVLNGYKNITSNIKTEVKNNTLRIFTEQRFRFESDKDIVLTVTIPSLTYLSISGESNAEIDGYVNERNLELSISGMGDMRMEGNARADNLKIKISGAGNMEIDHINVDKLEAGLSGIGDLKIKDGSASSAIMSISGAGEIDAEDFLCKTATIKVSGVGDVAVNVEQNMDVRISGAGDVRYKGHPAITKHVTGVGDISDNN